MDQKKEQLIGVIAAEVNSIEQRQIMQGIIQCAQELGKKTVVFSNLYNPYEYNPDLALENEVYQLMFSPQLCGLILIEESFLNETIRELMRGLIRRCSDIPIVAIGAFVEELNFPNVRFIDTDDAADTERMTAHLIDVHGLTQIDILTGHKDNPAAERRVGGFRRAMESHGLPCEDAHIHYGNFWMDSGEKLAGDYISGKLPLPQGIICANDYMAYGLLDTFLEYGIRVPEQVMIIGYEYIHERIYHAPLLSTYQRGRVAIGREAVRLLIDGVYGKKNTPFIPPEGIWIPGSSCSCGPDASQIRAELDKLRTLLQYNKWNVIGTMEQQLTLSSNLDDFVRVLGAHQFYVRYVQNMYLCLCEHWYDTDADTSEDILFCRSVMPWFSEHPTVACDRHDFSALYAYAPPTAVHYYLPLFFEKHFFGYYVLEYHQPDTYDDIFRNWMKSISNGLAFLGMKNDIRYLLQCQNLSEQHDSLTGLYNRRGFEAALATRRNENEPVHMIAVKLGVLQHDLHPELQAKHAQQIAELLRETEKRGGICGRLTPQVFVTAGFRCESEEMCTQLGQRLLSVLYAETDILETAGMASLLSVSMTVPAGESAAVCITAAMHKLQAATAALAEQKNCPHADTLFAVRSRLYQELTLTVEKVCRQYTFSAGYFRQIYKDCFGVSFHQDAINARISRASALLVRSVLSISSIAEKCGYEDYNYFLRQFQKVTGMTPGQYRKRLT